MQDLGPLFVHPSEPNRLWMLIVLLAVFTISVGIIVLYRGRLPAVLSSAGLLLIPAFAYILGDLMVMEDSKNVEFCGSCHEPMTALVESMRTGSDSLAAWHYQQGAVSFDEGCYQCHSGYGIWGTVNAKMAGVKHMWHTVTGNYEYPLQHAGRFDISSCLACHAAAKPFRAVETHRDPDIQKALLDGEMSCVGLCHPPAHPDDALRGLEHWRQVQAQAAAGDASGDGEAADAAAGGSGS